MRPAMVYSLFLAALAVVLAPWATLRSSPDWEKSKEAVVRFDVDLTTTTVVPVIVGISSGLPQISMVTQPVHEAWTGTGFVVSPDGYIVTCAHVVAAPEGSKEQILISFHGIPGRYIRPDVVYVNETIDIAVLKVNIPVSLPFLHLGDGEKVKPGDKVYSVGHPRGFSWSVAENQLAAKRFISGVNDAELYVYQLVNPLAQGVSGGPVMDRSGKVVCMSHMSYFGAHGAETSFCVPVQEIKWVLESQGVDYDKWLYRLL